MRSNIKRYVMPIMVTLLCLAMVFGMVYASVVITKQPSYEINGGNGGNGDNNDDMLSQTQLPDKLPADHFVKEVEEKYQVQPGKVPTDYANTALTDVLEITTKSQLQAWLLAPNNADRDAKLMDNISFDWDPTANEAGSDRNSSLYVDGLPIGTKAEGYRSAATDYPGNWKARIGTGRTLDGFGHTITFNNITSWIKSDQMNVCGFFTYEIYGNLLNTIFVVPQGAQLIHEPTVSNDMFSGLITAVAGVGEKSGIKSLISNCLVNIDGTYGMNTGTNGKDQYSDICVGTFAGKGNGEIRDCEVAIGASGQLRAVALAGKNGWGTQKASARCKMGGFVGVGSGTSTIVRGIFDLNLRGPGASGGFYYDSTLGAKPEEQYNRSGAAFGNTNGGSINGFIARDMNCTDPDGFGLFVGMGAGNFTKLYITGNDTYRWMSGTQPTVAQFTRIMSNKDPKKDINITWDRANADRLIFEQRNKSENEIFWNFDQYNGGTLDTAASVSDMYRYNLSTQKRYSIPARTPSTAINTGETASSYLGDKMDFNVGQVGKIYSVSVPSANVDYTGQSYPSTVVFHDPIGGVWNDTNCYKLKYNNLDEVPVMPGKYGTTLRAAAPPTGQANTYAYFDAAGRKLVWADDVRTIRETQLNIGYGKGTFTAKEGIGGNYTESYVDGKWTAAPIKINITIIGSSGAILPAYQPDNVRLTTATNNQQEENGGIVTWLETKPWKLDNTEYMLDWPGDGRTTFRFALFQGNIQITEIISRRTDALTEGILPKVDAITPTLKLADCHGGTTPTRNLNNWMDRYTPFDENKAIDDSLESSQVWFATTKGASALNVFVRGKRNADNFPIWEGRNMTSHPMKDGSSIDDTIFNQHMYRNNKTRAENQTLFGGVWTIQVRAMNEAGAYAAIAATNGGTYIETERALEFTVKVDYTDYTIDNTAGFSKVWNGDGGALDAGCSVAVNYPAEHNSFFTRNEPMNYTVTATQKIGNNGYSIVSAGGTPVPANENQLYNGAYNVPEGGNEAIATIPKIEIKLKKSVFGSVDAINDQQYGTAMPNFATDCLTLVNPESGIIFDTKEVTLLDKDSNPVVDFAKSKVVPVGTYTVKVAASIANAADNEKYEAIVADGTIKVIPKEITVKFMADTLSCSLRNFDKNWVKLDVDNFKTLLADGEKDTVIATSIYPTDPLPDVTNGAKTVQAVVTLSSVNYKVLNTAPVILAKFLTVPGDSTTYLIQTAADLNDIKDTFVGSNFRQDRDIDFGGNKVTPIGRFTGSYDGYGYKLSNFKLLQVASPKETPTYNIGFFTELAGSTAVIKNVVIDNAIVEYTGKANATANVGILVGSVSGAATINNVMVKGSVIVNGASSTTTSNVGLLAGSVVGDSKVIDSLVFGDLNVDNSMATTGTNANVGGAFGTLTDSTITNLNIFVQGKVKVVTGGKCNYLAGNKTITNAATTPITAVKYLDKAIVGVGAADTDADNIAPKKYADFVADKTIYGAVTIEMAQTRGMTFETAVKTLIPASMIAADGNINKFTVSTFKELLTMINYSWANFEITKDIHCFKGYTFDATQPFIGNITFVGEAKVIADNGTFVVGVAAEVPKPPVTPDPPVTP